MNKLAVKIIRGYLYEFVKTVVVDRITFSDVLSHILHRGRLG